MLKIEIYEDSAGEFRWRGVEANHRIIVDSAEGYVSFSGAERAVENVMTEFRGDVEVVRRDNGAQEVSDPTYRVVANYDAEGAHAPVTGE